MKEHTIDAQGKKVGRVASKAALLLLGKNDSSYVPNKVADVRVHIVNVTQLDIPEEKATQKHHNAQTPSNENYGEKATGRKHQGHIKRPLQPDPNNANQATASNNIPQARARGAE